MTEAELNVARCVKSVDNMPAQERERRAIDVTKIVKESVWLVRTRQRLDRARTRRTDLIIVVAR